MDVDALSVSEVSEMAEAAAAEAVEAAFLARSGDMLFSRFLIARVDIACVLLLWFFAAGGREQVDRDVAVLVLVVQVLFSFLAGWIMTKTNRAVAP